jgi:hypothetical protein
MALDIFEPNLGTIEEVESNRIFANFKIKHIIILLLGRGAFDAEIICFGASLFLPVFFFLRPAKSGRSASDACFHSRDDH